MRLRPGRAQQRRQRLCASTFAHATTYALYEERGQRCVRACTAVSVYPCRHVVHVGRCFSTRRQGAGSIEAGSAGRLYSSAAMRAACTHVHAHEHANYMQMRMHTSMHSMHHTVAGQINPSQSLTRSTLHVRTSCACAYACARGDAHTHRVADAHARAPRRRSDPQTAARSRGHGNQSSRRSTRRTARCTTHDETLPAPCT